jgi:hypothetical protein
MQPGPGSTDEAPDFAAAGLLRTARRLFQGTVHVPLEVIADLL